MHSTFNGLMILKVHSDYGAKYLQGSKTWGNFNPRAQFFNTFLYLYRDVVVHTVENSYVIIRKIPMYEKGETNWTS